MRRFLCCSIAASCALASPVSAAGADPRRGTEMGLYAGGTQLSDADTNETSALSVGYRLGRMFGPAHEVEFSIDRTRVRVAGADLEDVDFWTVSYLFNLDPMVPERVPRRAYVGIGLGIADHDRPPASDTSWELLLLSGLRAPVGSKFGIRAEMGIRAFDTFENESSAIQFSGGLTWILGKDGLGFGSGGPP